MTGFFSAYSSMSISFQGTKNGNADNLNLTYSVVYHSSTTYKVSINVLLNGETTPLTIWILNDGTILAVYTSGSNHTGSAAINTVLGYFSDLEALNTFALQESSNTAYFHSAGTSTVTIGSNTFTATDYVANTTPESFEVCSVGETAVLDSYNVYLGTPSGSSLEIVTSATFSGILPNLTSSGTNTVDYTYEVTALTVA